jgi:ATP-dependent Clp protease, protease subunit
MEKWIRLLGPINDKTAHSLCQVIDQQSAAGATHVHFMISSQGGFVHHGLSLAAYLQGLSVATSTYNFGQVQSIGVPVFCAGKHRFCVPSGTFMIHSVQSGPFGTNMLSIQQLTDALAYAHSGTNSIATLIADATGQPLSRVLTDMNKTTYFSADEAKKYGLIHEIRSDVSVLLTAPTISRRNLLKWADDGTRRS